MLTAYHTGSGQVLLVEGGQFTHITQGPLKQEDLAQQAWSGRSTGSEAMRYIVKGKIPTETVITQ